MLAPVRQQAGIAIVLAAAAAGCLAVMVWQDTSPVELEQYPPPKWLPLDGDYPGGRTGIPVDGYYKLETGHGALPYFGDPTVVSDPNDVYGMFGYARSSRALPVRPTALAEVDDVDSEAGNVKGQLAGGFAQGRGGQMWVYGEPKQEPVSTRPDAACYHCVKNFKDSMFAMYRACGDVCQAADCVSTCEEQNTGGMYGPTVPAFVSELCMRDCKLL